MGNIAPPIFSSSTTPHARLADTAPPSCPATPAASVGHLHRNLTASDTEKKKFFNLPTLNSLKKSVDEGSSYRVPLSPAIAAHALQSSPMVT